MRPNPIYRKLLVEDEDISVSGLTVGIYRYPSQGGEPGQTLVLGPDNTIIFDNVSRDLTISISGAGVTNYIPKFVAPRVLGLSKFYDTGSFVGLNTTQPTNTLDVNGTLRVRDILNATGSFTTLSPSGVFQQRTPAQVLIDTGANDKFVPYTGSLRNVDLGEFGIRAGYYLYDTTPTDTPAVQGTTYWDVDDNTVAIIMNGSIQKVGEDSFYQVKNQTGTLIPKGTNVRFAGTVGSSGRLLVAPFIADGSVSSTYYMGVTMEALADGADGKVLWFGRIRGLNTNAFNEGDILYASTTTAGGFQTAIPQAPNNIVEVAAVVTKSATVGAIFIRPTLGSNINKDEGVLINLPANNQSLVYSSGSGLWENKITRFAVQNSSGSVEFYVNNESDLKFQGSGDTTVSFNTATRTVVISSTGGSTGGTGVVSFNGRDGAVVSIAGDYNTSQVAEVTNLYFTETRVRNTVLTGLTNSTSAIVATDSIIVAFGKTQGQLNVKQPLAENLTSLSSLVYASPAFVKMTGVDTFTLDTTVYLSVVNLGYTPSPTNGIVTNSAGTSSTLTLVTTVNAGLMSPGDKSKLDGIAANANNYVHPTYTSRSIDTTGAQVVDVFTSDTSGSVTNITTRTMTLADLGYTGATDANNYVHPTYTATNPTLTGALVLASFTSDTIGSVTGITTRTLTLANLGYTGVTNADNYASWLIAASGTAGTATIGSGNTVTLNAGTGMTVTRVGSTITFATTITQYTDALARAAISLTTTGTSGASTYTSGTGVLNVPTYTLAGLGGFVNPMTTLGDVIYGGTSGVATRLAGNTTTARQYFAQTGTGTVSAVPAWTTIAGSDVTGAALTKTDDTNVTLTLGGTPATSLLRAASITVGWSGQLTVSRGGTGASTLTGVLIGNGTSAITAVAGTASQLLRRNAGNTAYEFFTHNFETAFSKGDLVQGAATTLTGTLTSRLVGAGNITIDHADTSTQASVSNIDGTVLQSVTLDTYGHTTALTSLNGDNRWARLIEVLNNSSIWSHVPLQNGIDFTGYTTGSSGYPSTLGFAVAFYAATSDSTSGFGRAFALNREYNTENYYIGSPNTSGVHNGWRLLYHAGNLSISTLSGVPTSRTLTINSTAFDLSANRSWSIDLQSATTVGNTTSQSIGIGQGSAAGETYLNIGANKTVNSPAYIDFQSRAGSIDYDFRILKNSGASGIVDIRNMTGSIQIVTESASQIILATSNTARMTVDAGGNVQINTLTSRGKLTVVGANALDCIAAGTDSTHQILVGADASYAEIQGIRHGILFDKNIVMQRQGANVLIGTTTDSGQKFQVGGTGLFSSTVTASNFITSSDRRLKTEIQKIKNALAKLSKISSYEYLKDGEKEAGFIAQEVQEILPYAVQESKDGYLTMSDRPILAYMHKAILELRDEIEKLKN